MRRAALAFALVVVAGIAAMTVLAAGEDRTLAFTLGVPSFGPSAILEPGAEACQQAIPVAAAFDAVELHAGTFRAPGPALAVTVRRATDAKLLAHGRLEAGYADNTRPVVPVGRVPAEGTIAICLRNAGQRRVALYGGPDVAARTSTALLDGAPTANDLDLVLRTSDARSTLGLVPDMLDRASLFRGGWIGPWLYWILLAAVLLAVPVYTVFTQQYSLHYFIHICCTKHLFLFACFKGNVHLG